MRIRYPGFSTIQRALFPMTRTLLRPMSVRPAAKKTSLSAGSSVKSSTATATCGGVVVADWAIGMLVATGFGVGGADLGAERCGWASGVAVGADAVGIAVGSLIFVPQPLSRNVRTAKKATCE